MMAGPEAQAEAEAKAEEARRIAEAEAAVTRAEEEARARAEAEAAAATAAAAAAAGVLVEDSASGGEEDVYKPKVGAGVCALVDINCDDGRGMPREQYCMCSQRAHAWSRTRISLLL